MTVGVGGNDPRGERAQWLAKVRQAAAGTTLADRTRSALEAGDPAAEMSRRVAIVSLGNALEAHGPALAPDIDDRTAQALSVRVSGATGARYLGHCPYSTDGVGALARAWSPVMLEPEVFIDRVAAYVEHLLVTHYDHFERARPEVLFFISGHGGNSPLVGALPELSDHWGVAHCRYRLCFTLPPEAKRPLQHADDHEHSAALTIGAAAVDRDALARLQRDLSSPDTFWETVARYPAVAGMTGFYVLGAPPFDAIRRRYEGVKAAVRDAVETRDFTVSEAWGQRIMDYSAECLADELLSMADAAGVSRR